MLEKQERERGRGGKGVIRIVGGSGWCWVEEVEVEGTEEGGGLEEVGSESDGRGGGGGPIICNGDAPLGARGILLALCGILLPTNGNSFNE